MTVMDLYLAMRKTRLMNLSTTPYALAVDDDALILMDACDILKSLGFRYYDAHSADEALAILGQFSERITLLFTDVEMPGSINGFALAQKVAEAWPHIEIVVASGRAQPKTGEMPDKATFISKPFSASVVRAHLAETLPDGKKPEPLRTAV